MKDETKGEEISLLKISTTPSIEENKEESNLSNSIEKKTIKINQQ